MDGSNIKLLTKRMASDHEANGCSFAMVNLDRISIGWLAENEGLVPVNVTPDNQARRAEGQRVSPRFLRQVMYEWRGMKGLNREGAFLWTVYDGEKNLTLVGVGCMVRAEVAERAVAMRPWMQIEEVEYVSG